MNAFVLIHFGNKPKYVELEIYTVLMLKNNTKYDIIYMYSINDTPQYFLDIMKKYCTKLIPYDDTNVTYDIKNFTSLYQHFNTLRTCNFLYAYKLTQYKKVCIIESDMIIMKNIDDIFLLKTPSVLTYYDETKVLENYKINIDINKNLTECSKKSNINGGVMLIKPSLAKYKQYLKNIKKIIEYKCIYPNETLFLMGNKYIYNLPFKYNGVKYYLDKYSHMFKIDITKYQSIVHMNSKEHKHIDVIRDNWLNIIKKTKKTLYYFILYFKNNYYNKYQKDIDSYNLLNNT
jgi:alpha-N-acetylglucosamine transferase